MAVVQPQMEDDAASSAQTTSGESLETLDSVPQKMQLLEVALPPSSSHMRLGFRTPQTHKSIPSLLLITEPNLSPMKKLMPDKPGCVYPCT